MTGGSLGLRTGSYGVLQNINGAFACGGISRSSRKSSTKMLSGIREKERPLLNVCYRYIGYRKVSMLLLIVFALLVCVLGSFVVNKACPVCYLHVDQTISSMSSSRSASPVLHNLTYVLNENPIKSEARWL